MKQAGGETLFDSEKVRAFAIAVRLEVVLNSSASFQPHSPPIKLYAARRCPDPEKGASEIFRKKEGTQQ